MRKRLIIIMVGIVVTSVGFTGCSSTTTSKKIDKTNNKVTESVDNRTQQSDGVKNNASEYMIKLDKQEEEFMTYTADIDSYTRKDGEKVWIKNNIPLIEGLQSLANKVSSKYFSNLPIEVLAVSILEGKKVAVINLEESKENQGKEAKNIKGNSWATGYLQGSAGGKITETSLIETFLQRDYKGNWIDGVQFKYNRNPCKFEHAPKLENVVYRDEYSK